MSCNPGRWLWGLIPVVMLIWVALAGEHRGIQTDLRIRATEALNAAGYGWATPGLSGRDAVIVGRAHTEEQRQRAVEVASGVWGVRVVENQASLMPPPKNFVWSADRSERAVRLSGYAPTEQARSRIVAVAKERFPKAAIEDWMIVASGGPTQTDWEKNAEFAVDQLVHLAPGAHVDLEGHDFGVEGRASTIKDYKLIRERLSRNLPSGVHVKTDKVRPPAVSPYVWGAVFKANQLELTGHVPDERQRDELLAHARRTFPKATIIDRMATASGEPRQWQLAAMRALSRLGELESGAITLTDQSLVLRGATEREITALAVSKALKVQVPASFNVSDAITYRTPAIPVVNPYMTQVEIADSGTRISGHVPSDEARAALLASLAAPSRQAEVNDAASLGSGAISGWLACLKAGLQGLEKLGGGKLVLTGRKLQLIGQTANEDMIAETAAMVRAAANRACDVESKIAFIALPEPDLQWSAMYDDNRLVMTGEVPDQATKSKLALRAKELFPGTEISDHTTVKTSLSAKWPVTALTGVELLSKLRSGVSAIEGQRLTIRGQAPDTVTASAIRDTLKRSLPHGYTGSDNIVVRSDAMMWAAQEAKRKLAEDAKRKREEEAAAERKKEAEKQAALLKERDAARIKEQAEEASRRQRQEFEERQREAARRAKAQAEADAARAARRLQAESDSKKKAAEVSPAIKQSVATEVARKKKVEIDCRDAMRSAVRTGRIRFGRGRAIIRKESYPTLDKLAKVVEGCPSAIVEIEGHADADGNAARNLRLSRRRAEAVRHYLVKAGIDAKRLRAIGYGESRPLVPNTTKANKAYNRRIDFTVRVK